MVDGHAIRIERLVVGEFVDAFCERPDLTRPAFRRLFSLICCRFSSCGPSRISVV